MLHLPYSFSLHPPGPCTLLPQSPVAAQPGKLWAAVGVGEPHTIVTDVQGITALARTPSIQWPCTTPKPGCYPVH